MENSAHVIMTVDRAGTILSINRAMSGVTPQQAIGKKINEFTHPEYRYTLKKNFEQVFQTGALARFEIVGAGPERANSWYEVQVGPVKHGGKVSAATVIAADITQRKLAEKTLRESEERFRELADLLPQTVFEIDLQGNFTFANNAGLQTTGYLQEDVDRGLNALQLFVPEDRKRVMNNIEKVLKGEEFGSHEYTALRKDGTPFRVLAYTSPIFHDEKIVGMRGIILDITERKRAEDQLSQHNRELAALNAIAQTLTQSLDLDEILSKALDKTLEMLGIEHGGIYLSDSKANTLNLRIWKGIDANLAGTLSPVRAGQGVPGIVARSGEPMFIESLPDSVEWIGKELREAVIVGRLRSVMCVPLQARGAILGVMFALTQGDRRLSPD
ncbi:MAG: PAS domain S-box protein [Deltaproteobacteria bacterium]|nr:PAS domain S-box protein [Deltaproteobacteria bacterium]